MTTNHRFLIGGVALAACLVAAPATAQTSDVEVAITKAPDVMHYGERKTYIATITNHGPSLAKGVKVESIDVVAPAVLKGVTNCTPVTKTAQFPCVVGNGEIVDDVGSPATHAATVTFDVELPFPGTPPHIENLPTTCPDGSGLSPVTITVSSTSTDPDAANNTATAAAPVIGGWADLAIKMSAPARASVGDTIDVKVEITNNGPCDATDVAADDEEGMTALSLEFLSADGDCTVDPLADTCTWPTLVKGESKSWTLHYKVLPLAESLMQNGEPVTVTVYSTADLAYDYNPANDVDQTKTIVHVSRGGCSSGDMGGALSLLALGLPFLRRRRKS